MPKALRRLLAVGLPALVVTTATVLRELPHAATDPSTGNSSTATHQDPQPAAAASRTGTKPDVDYQRDIEPLLREHCFRCHGDKKQKGDVQLNTLDPAMAARADAEGWHAALDMIQSGEMPPEDEPQFSTEQRRLLTGWLRSSLDQAADRLAGERRVVLRRLTREQYTNSLQDLLSVSIDFAQTLPEDGKAKNGFSNVGEVLQSSPLHLETYQQLARQGLQQAIAQDKPEVTHYRIEFGKGTGRGKVAGRTGGYQSVPLNPDDFTVEILDADGQPRAPGDDAEREAMAKVQKKISVGLRGSGQDRFRVVDEGMMLLSALPHREVVPKSWQGPSPNLKLEMQRVWPRQGDFVMRVRASRGYVPPLRKQLLLSLEEDAQPLARFDGEQPQELQLADGAMLLAATASDQRKNLKLDGEALLPVDVPKPSKARLAFTLPDDGFYQVDLVHAPRSNDGMPSVRLRCAGHNVDQRLQFDEEQLKHPAVVTPLGAIGMRKGRHHLEVGGPFFVGFTHVVITPLGSDHKLVQRLTTESAEQEKAAAALTPAIRALIGTRTDDGMDYTTFGESVEVTAPLGAAQTYEFFGRLENLPIPEPESGDKEILSGFLLLGLWNDHLVKSPRETGPPLLVETIEFEAPYLPQWPPKSHTDIFFESGERSDDESYARAVLSRFVSRAFRRPARAAEVERYLDFWRQLRDSGEWTRFEDQVQEVLVAVLCSPEFLFLCEPLDELGSEGELADWMLANRLSYFLWNAPPDETLRQRVAAGTLRAVMLHEVDRMLDDDRSDRMVARFADEWLRLDRQRDMAINVGAHRDYTRFVRRDMREETVRFLAHVLREDLPLETLVQADFAMLNQNLAEFYGVEGPDGKVLGPTFRPVAIAADHPERRAGLLSHGAFYVGHSDGSEPHPIKRAVWLKARLLGDEPPPPPPNVPDLDPETPGFDQMTLKQRIESHRDKASCRDCHASIDPFGFVFERMSAVGRLEPKRKGHAVDATSTMPDGTPVDGLEGIQSWLVDTQQDRLARSFVEHLLGYALGRELSFADEPQVDDMMQQLRIGGYRARAAVRAIVASPLFRSK
ncbi:MAG: DUF1592 domain-containing protein [Planctomycetota bacterium]